MRKLVYVVSGQEITSYEKARELQPTGRLETRLDVVEEEFKVNPQSRQKRTLFFARKRAKNLARALS